MEEPENLNKTTKNTGHLGAVHNAVKLQLYFCELRKTENKAREFICYPSGITMVPLTSALK